MLVCVYYAQVKFRNAQHDTFVAISYINRRITVSDSAAHGYVAVTELCSHSMQVLTNIHGVSDWNHCFVVPDVDLPTGYFLGMSAATGDLAGQYHITTHQHTFKPHQ